MSNPKPKPDLNLEYEAILATPEGQRYLDACRISTTQSVWVDEGLPTWRALYQKHIKPNKINIEYFVDYVWATRRLLA